MDVLDPTTEAPEDDFRWWGWLLSPFNAVGVIVALPALLVLWIADDRKGEHG